MGITLTACAGKSSAEPWAITPRLGISSYYFSDPDLLYNNTADEANVAALLDLPVSYDSDGVEILIRPNARFSSRGAYSSLAANYAHLDANAQFVNDLGSTSLQGELARDSSLYFAGALANGVGVRRDGASTGADWTRSMTERSQVELDAGWSQVRYSQAANRTNLVDYRYISAGPTFSYALTELNTLKVLGSVGQYRSLNGLTESKSDSLQLGFVRQLTKIWKLTASAGYSHSQNSESIYFGPYLLGTLKTNQGGAVFAASLTRQSEKFTFNVGGSQALQPTGFAFLSRQDAVTLGTTYTHSERWNFGLSATWQKAVNPEIRNEVISAHYLNTGFSANFHWTEQLSISFHATRITQEYGPPKVSAASNGVSLDIVRQFLRTDL